MLRRSFVRSLTRRDWLRSLFVAPAAVAVAAASDKLLPRKPPQRELFGSVPKFKFSDDFWRPLPKFTLWPDPATLWRDGRHPVYRRASRSGKMVAMSETIEEPKIAWPHDDYDQ